MGSGQGCTHTMPRRRSFFTQPDLAAAARGPPGKGQDGVTH
jgi:hypothetical protein